MNIFEEASKNMGTKRKKRKGEKKERKKIHNRN